MRPPSVDAMQASATGPHCAQRRYSLGSLGCCFGRDCLLEFLIDGGSGSGRAADATGEFEIPRFWTALVTEFWLLGTESPASLIRL